jgi:hypothetical protein
MYVTPSQLTYFIGAIIVSINTSLLIITISNNISQPYSLWQKGLKDCNEVVEDSPEFACGAQLGKTEVCKRN